MTNIFAEDITYLTIEEYKWSSQDVIDDEEIKIYVRKAEVVIDKIIWSYWKPQNINQKTIFPVIDVGVPIEIKKATVLITNCLYWGKDRIDTWKVISSESRRGNSVTYDTSRVDKYKNIHPCYNSEIHSYLEKFIKNDKLKTSCFFRT